MNKYQEALDNIVLYCGHANYDHYLNPRVFEELKIIQDLVDQTETSKEIKVIKNEIYKILKDFGIGMNLVGYELVSSAIFRIIFNYKKYIMHFCMIYYDLAKEYDIAHTSVQRTIRYAVESIDFNLNKELTEEYFGKSLIRKNSFTVSEFVFGIARKLMLKYEQNNNFTNI